MRQQQVEEDVEGRRHRMSSTLPLCILLAPLRDHRPRTHPTPRVQIRSDHSCGRWGRRASDTHSRLCCPPCYQSPLTDISGNIPPSSFPSGSDMSSTHTTTQTHNHTNTHRFFRVIQESLRYLGDLKLLPREKTTQKT